MRTRGRRRRRRRRCRRRRPRRGCARDTGRVARTSSPGAARAARDGRVRGGQIVRGGGATRGGGFGWSAGHFGALWCGRRIRTLTIEHPP